jgi:hypothetical protein
MTGMAWELRDDALSGDGAGFVLRVGLPWMRSLPVSSVLDLVIEIDRRGVPAEHLRVRLAGEHLPLAALAETETWWFLQDRLVIAGPWTVRGHTDHEVEVSMQLLLPYLDSPSGGPAVLPFRFARRLRANASTAAGVFRDVS